MPFGFDPSGPNESQGYITEVATRALIFIEADNPKIGLMCFMAVGMAEVSTCDISVYEGQYVNKGEQLGMFHFGGSTHCLIFRPGVNLDFDLHGQSPGLESKNIPVNSQIAIVNLSILIAYSQSSVKIHNRKRFVESTMLKINRRSFISGSFASLLTAPVYAFTSTPLSPTPGETEGPFYPVWMQKDKDFDLTKIAGKSGVAKGKTIIIQGRVIDTHGQAVEDALVDLWQANAAGRYRHPYDTNQAPLDPNFQGWAIVPSGKDGKFLFKTIYPGAYPASRSWTRPPHIHFKISKKGYVEVVTQMYFPNHPLNDMDRLLMRKNQAEQKQMIAIQISDKPETYEYIIVLEKV